MGEGMCFAMFLLRLMFTSVSLNSFPLQGEGWDGGESTSYPPLQVSTPTLTLPLHGGGNVFRYFWGALPTSPLSLPALHPDSPAPHYSRSALLASPVRSNTCFWRHRMFSGPGAVRHPARSPAFFPHTQSPQYKRLSHAGAGSGSLQVVFPASRSKACAQHRSSHCAAA